MGKYQATALCHFVWFCFGESKFYLLNFQLNELNPNPLFTPHDNQLFVCSLDKLWIKSDGNLNSSVEIH